jgi:hypothetical protein
MLTLRVTVSTRRLPLSRISDSVVQGNTPDQNFVKKIVDEASSIPNFDAESTNLANQAASPIDVACSVVTEENNKCILYTLYQVEHPCPHGGSVHSLTRLEKL